MFKMLWSRDFKDSSLCGRGTTYLIKSYFLTFQFTFCLYLYSLKGELKTEKDSKGIPMGGGALQNLFGELVNSL